MMMIAAKKVMQWVVLVGVLGCAQLKAMDYVYGLVGAGGHEGWAEETFTERLNKQDFNNIMNSVYRFVDEEHNADVEGWITRQADAGHVPMLYMDARRLLRITDAEMKAEQRADAFKQMCIALVRTAQDAACCTLISGRAESGMAYDVLQKKFYERFLSGHDARRWPNYAAVFETVYAWFEQEERIEQLPPPAWCCFCGWRTLSRATVVFGTPAEAFLAAQNSVDVRALIDKMRAAVYQKAKTVLGAVHNWEEFFHVPVTTFFPETADGAAGAGGDGDGDDDGDGEA